MAATILEISRQSRAYPITETFRYPSAGCDFSLLMIGGQIQLCDAWFVLALLRLAGCFQPTGAVGRRNHRPISINRRPCNRNVTMVVLRWTALVFSS